MSAAGRVLLGFVGEQVGASGQRKHSKVRKAVAIDHTRLCRPFLFLQLLSARRRAVFTSEDSVLGYVIAEVGYVFGLPSLEESGLGAH